MLKRRHPLLRPESCKKKSSCPLRGPRPDRNEISQALLASSSPKEGSSSSRTYLLCRHLIRALTMWRDGRDDSDPHAPSPCVFRGDGSDSQPLLPHNWQATPWCGSNSVQGGGVRTRRKSSTRLVLVDHVEDRRGGGEKPLMPSSNAFKV